MTTGGAAADAATTDEPSVLPTAPPFPARRLAPLVAAQALFQSGMSVDLTLTGLVGYQLAPSPALATVPFAAITLGAAATSAPASACVRRWGYRTAFLAGATAATFGGVASAVAIHLDLFLLFVVGTFAVGVYQGFANYYRYAAADEVPAGHRSRAIATVLAGGVVAAVAGPFLATAARGTLATEFAGSYGLVSLLAAGSGAVLLRWRATPPFDPTAGATAAGRGPVAGRGTAGRGPVGNTVSSGTDGSAAPGDSTAAAGETVAGSGAPAAGDGTEERGDPGRRGADAAGRPGFREVVLRPRFLAGVGGTAAGYLVMMLLMTAAPIAAVGHDHSIEQGALAVQWHMVGMFAPSLVSGWVVRRLGATTVLGGGIALAAASAGVGLAGTSQAHFMVALLLLGVGWNGMYVSGTTLIAGSYAPHERARVQAAGELLTTGGSAIGALSAGALLSRLGWGRLNVIALLPLLAGAALAARHARDAAARHARDAAARRERPGDPTPADAGPRQRRGDFPGRGVDPVSRRS